MCGIAGFIAGQGAADAGALTPMLARIAHRGPDGQGTFVEGPAALGHCRLAIIDLAGGAQPLYSEDKNLVIVFNGEIYNYKALTAELTALGHCFATRTDTEVLLHGWEQWGRELLPRLRGMFAFALWDRRAGTLFCARDMFGIKPLYYCRCADGTLLFASEIKAFLAHPAFEKRLNEARLPDWLSMEYLPDRETLFAGVYELPPAHTLCWQNGRVTGTASTEADEFSEIYGLNIVSIPTNKPRARQDLPDSVYKTVNGKYNAVIDQVAECHAKGQPVLVGTVSVEKSEALSKLLKKRGIEHNVLNAKQHEREAEIVAQAGKQGAVTIATNMAGRGTDIMLGGNVTYMAKAALKKELSKALTADLAQLKDEYEHAKARAKANGTELPTPPEAGIDAKLEMLMTECDGHAETEDAEILHARKRFEELCEEFAPEVKREAEVVRAAGGLFIIGTERHESRRIDNQLRGRAGRQGDPGASRFFLSLEDDLMRIFGGDRVQNLMDSLGLDEDVPIENKLITNTIESAQKKLEASNFAIRKQVLQYDDVMNQQREIIYKQRQMVLDGEDISGKLHEMMRQAIDDACANYLNGETADDWDFAGLRRHFMNWLCLPTDFNYTTEQLGELTREGIADELYKRGMDILTTKEKRYGEKTMRELERICLLRNVDSKWMEHIDNMDQLKQGMGLRGYGQHDPVVEYRIEGFAMFDEMIASIREDAVHMLLTIEIRQQNAEPKREQVAKPTGEGAPAQAGAKGAAPVRVTKIGRNDPCPCGSGLKWKKCTCKEYHPDL